AGLNGSMCECGSMIGTCSRAALRSRTRVSAGMRWDLRRVHRQECLCHRGLFLVAQAFLRVLAKLLPPIRLTTPGKNYKSSGRWGRQLGEEKTKEAAAKAGSEKSCARFALPMWL